MSNALNSAPKGSYEYVYELIVKNLSKLYFTLGIVLTTAKKLNLFLKRQLNI